jgi:hypothetical protein
VSLFGSSKRPDEPPLPSPGVGVLAVLFGSRELPSKCLDPTALVSCRPRATTLDPDEPLLGLAYEPTYAERVLTDNGLFITARRRGTWREVRRSMVTQDWLCAVRPTSDVIISG